MPIRDVTPEQFGEIDAVVMRSAYASQNELGRLFEERIYENDVAARLTAEGLEVQTQVPVQVEVGPFRKDYFVDLLVEDMPYELKTVAAFLPEHRAQCLQYAMLMDVRRIKLVNFRLAKVQGELLYNPITSEMRRTFAIHADAWWPMTDRCLELRSSLAQIVQEMGTHLGTRLYAEALIEWLGGPDRCLQRLTVGSHGTHLVQCHAPGHAFVVTGFTTDGAAQESHLRRFMSNLRLDGLQWINLNRSTVSLITLQP